MREPLSLARGRTLDSIWSSLDSSNTGKVHFELLSIFQFIQVKSLTPPSSNNSNLATNQRTRFFTNCSIWWVWMLKATSLTTSSSISIPTYLSISPVMISLTDLCALSGDIATILGLPQKQKKSKVLSEQFASSYCKEPTTPTNSSFSGKYSMNSISTKMASWPQVSCQKCFWSCRFQLRRDYWREW